MFQTLKNAFKVKEIRHKIYWTLLFLLVYRIGCYIPVPGVGTSLLTETDINNASYLNIMSMMTGGSLQYGTLFAMGIGPYINASIIMQLLAVAIPPLERLSKQGEEGRKKIAQYTRYLTILLAIIQSVGIILSYGRSSIEAGSGNPTLSAILAGGVDNVSGFTTAMSYIIVVLFFTAGTCITMWIGERITDYGISNGISLLIFAGILATAGTFTINEVRSVFEAGFNREQLLRFVGYILIIVVVFGLIVWVELAERKIQVQYAKQVKGRKMYGGQSTVIPIKVNANGVMPLIFAFSILTFPELIMTLFGWTSALAWWGTWLGSTSRYPFYAIVLALLIVFFAFFYSQIQFNPEDISKTIQQNGGFIPGIRPGKPTADYLKKISNRLTLFGAIFLALVALIPALVLNAILPGSGSSGAFSATGMLIAVSVALELKTALESQIMMKNYKGFLK
ncbi:MAG TPA: preprotein translocase subunit SecY [Clostridiales bacterium]|nr:preprotein translocase subunit SecY [Clostridiales bacterium]